MKSEEEIFNLLKENFKDKIKELVKQPVDHYILCDPLKINEISLFLLSNEELLFDSLMNLSGVDDANGKSTSTEGITTIEGGTLSVYYHLESTKHRHVVVLKVRTADRVNPAIDSVSDVWITAKYHEREAYDLLGIHFNNHTDLRRLFLEDGWGFPLRKDYVDEVRIVER